MAELFFDLKSSFQDLCYLLSFRRYQALEILRDPLHACYETLNSTGWAFGKIYSFSKTLSFQTQLNVPHSSNYSVQPIESLEIIFSYQPEVMYEEVNNIRR
jgi:hypothetical protein